MANTPDEVDPSSAERTSEELGDRADLITVSEGARRYQVSKGTLGTLLRCGIVAGRKVRGPRGQEWRLEPASLEAAGYVRRTAPEPGSEAELHPDPGQIERDLQRRLTFEQRRRRELQDQLDRALTELEALRARVADLHGDQIWRKPTFAERGIAILRDGPAPGGRASPG